jgi:hypothetical protein
MMLGHYVFPVLKPLLDIQSQVTDTTLVDLPQITINWDYIILFL